MAATGVEAQHTRNMCNCMQETAQKLNPCLLASAAQVQVAAEHCVCYRCEALARQLRVRLLRQAPRHVLLRPLDDSEAVSVGAGQMQRACLV